MNATKQLVFLYSFVFFAFADVGAWDFVICAALLAGCGVLALVCRDKV